MVSMVGRRTTGYKIAIVKKTVRSYFRNDTPTIKLVTAKEEREENES